MLPTRIQSCTPWRDGMSPVSSDARAGEHTGDVQKKLVNLTPCCASRSSTGVRELAATHEYSVNRQASGLRKGRSGLIGMIIPMHDNRFFSGMSQVFEKLARERHWYPIVVSTLRDPALELETVRTLISYRI